MVSTAHRLQCKTQYFPKHKVPVHGTEINCRGIRRRVNGVREEVDGGRE